MTKKPIFWFDIDGVLAKYDYSLYIPAGDETPLYLQRHSHVFRKSEPDPKMIELFTSMYKRYHKEHLYYTRILSGIPAGLLQAEYTLDKYAWCTYHMVDLKQEDFYVTSIEKHSAVCSDIWELTKLDILIDDWNPNLDNWRKNGGTAVKYVNGINSPRDDMLNLRFDMDPAYMQHLLEAAASGTMY